MVGLIIHGKPVAGGHKASQGLDEDLALCLYNDFFKSKNAFKGQDALIVDTRCWKNVWYSIYTYWVSTNIKETGEERASYIAISLICPYRYYLFTSGVYEHLKFLYQNYVVNQYVSATGKYLVYDFNDENKFLKLYSNVGCKFTNLEEDFDDNFASCPQSNTPVHYNVIDCDSKAFIDDLRKNGRILVSDNYETKDSKLNKVNQYAKALRNTQLKYEELQRENESLRNEQSNLTAKLSHVQEASSKDSDKVMNLQNCHKEYIKVKRQHLYFSILLISVLFIIILFFLILIPKGNKNDANAPIALQDSCRTEQSNDKEDDVSDNVNEDELESFQHMLTSELMNHHLLLISIYKIENASDSTGRPVLVHSPNKYFLFFGSKRGFDFHFDNIKNVIGIKDSITHNRAFNIEKKDEKKDCIITYRRDNEALNDSNKITIK